MNVYKVLAITIAISIASTAVAICEKMSEDDYHWDWWPEAAFDVKPMVESLQNVSMFGSRLEVRTNRSLNVSLTFKIMRTDTYRNVSGRVYCRTLDYSIITCEQGPNAGIAYPLIQAQSDGLRMVRWNGAIGEPYIVDFDYGLERIKYVNLTFGLSQEALDVMPVGLTGTVRISIGAYDFTVWVVKT
jgi:hypothetical protein